jgi:prepilin-type N-terminal cleavage/methylation domain-containing protein
MKRRRVSAQHRAFTLIEVMLAVLILALLATAAALSMDQPLRAARSRDLLQQLHAFDMGARQAAILSGKDVRIVFDLSSNSVSRFDGGQLTDLRRREHLPPGFRIDQVLLSATSAFSGEVPIDISPMGFSRSYAIHLIGPGPDRWIIFAGLSGDTTQARDEATTHAILAETSTAM